MPRNYTFFLKLSSFSHKNMQFPKKYSSFFFFLSTFICNFAGKNDKKR